MMHFEGKKRHAVGLACCLGLLTAACSSVPAHSTAGASAAANSQPLLTAKLAVEDNALSPITRGMVHFAKLVSTLTHGAVKITVYDNATLGTGVTTFEGLTTNSVQFVDDSMATEAAYDPDLTALELPFEFSTPKAMYTVLDSPLAQQIYAQLEPKGIKLLAGIESGFFDLESTTPIKSLAAIKGIHVRVPPGTEVTDMWTALGAVPSVIAITEVYTALETHTVTAVETALSAYLVGGFYQVAPDVSLINYFNDPNTLNVSMGFWKELSPTEQKEVTKAAQEGAVWERALADKSNSEAETGLKGEGVTFYTPSPAFHRALVSAEKPVDAIYEKQLGNSLVKQVLKAAQKANK
jgi:TRAP-type C4-dicarboxylate transport system substrate-binding protein